MYSLYFNLDDDSHYEGDFKDVYEAISTGYKFTGDWCDVEGIDCWFQVLNETNKVIFDSKKPYDNPEIVVNCEGW